MEQATIRCFIAIEPDAKIREFVRCLIDDLRQILPNAKWIRSEGAHITLKFLGTTKLSLLPEIAASLGQILDLQKPFHLRLSQLGFFKNRHEAVLWLGVEELSKCLDSLAKEIEMAMVPFGFAPDGRPFRAHLTLARVPVRRLSSEVNDKIANFDTGTGQEFLVDHLAVYESTKVSDQGQYVVRERVSFSTQRKPYA
jgi:RNA 2',3'-cyclic 3'-phosphodiesterase